MVVCRIAKENQTKQEKIKRQQQKVATSNFLYYQFFSKSIEIGLSQEFWIIALYWIYQIVSACIVLWVLCCVVLCCVVLYWIVDIFLCLFNLFIVLCCIVLYYIKSCCIE